jgi:hypothetical protein
VGLFGGKEKAREKYLDAALDLMPILDRLERSGGSMSPSDPDFPVFKRQARSVFKRAEKAGVPPGWLPPEQVQSLERMGHPDWPELFQRFCGFITGVEEAYATLTDDDGPGQDVATPGSEAAAGQRYSEVATIAAQAAATEVSGKDLVLCSSALRAAGLAAELFVGHADDDDEEDEGEPHEHRLREHMLLVARTGSRDAVGRVVSGLAWYYPLKLAADDPDRARQDVDPWLQMIHRGLHPLESLVVVTDADMIFDLYERGPDGGRFAIGMARWLAMHLGDPNPDVPDLWEALRLEASLASAWQVFAAGLRTEMA